MRKVGKEKKLTAPSYKRLKTEVVFIFLVQRMMSVREHARTSDAAGKNKKCCFITSCREIFFQLPLIFSFFSLSSMCNSSTVLLIGP